MNQDSVFSSQTPTQVFIKNFIAGFARGLGSLFVYILFTFVSYYFLVKPQLPQVKHFFELYQKSVESITQLKQPSLSMPNTNFDVQDLLKQLQNLN